MPTGNNTPATHQTPTPADLAARKTAEKEAFEKAQNEETDRQVADDARADERQTWIQDKDNDGKPVRMKTEDYPEFVDKKENGNENR